MGAYQPGAATSIEVMVSLGNPSYTPSENIVPAGLRPPNRTTRTYDGPAVTLRYDRAGSSMARDRRRSQPWDGRQARACNRSRRSDADSDGRSLQSAGPGQPVQWLRHSPVSSRARSLWLGTDWSEERALDKAGLERVEGADTRRAGPTWAVGRECVAGNADSDRGSDWDGRHLFRSRIRPLSRVEIGRDRDPIPTQ